MRGRLLIVDDHRESRDAIATGLAAAGFQVAGLDDVALALAHVHATRPLLALAEVHMAGRPRFEFLRRARDELAGPPLPIVLVSAQSQELDRVTGFELGADDFVGKPFSARELVLRVEALLRRSQRQAHCETLEAGPIRVDLGAHEVRIHDGDLDLTAREFALLVELVRHRGRVVRREQLLSQVCGRTETLDSRAVDTLVTRLRRKLGAHGASLETVRSVGYRLRDS